MDNFKKCSSCNRNKSLNEFAGKSKGVYFKTCSACRFTDTIYRNKKKQLTPVRSSVVPFMSSSLNYLKSLLVVVFSYIHIY